MSSSSSPERANVVLKPDGAIAVSGEVSFNNVVFLKNAGEPLIDGIKGEVVVDMSAVDRAGSAAISLLLSWLRYCQFTSKEIIFRNLPDDLMGLAMVSGVDELLPVTTTETT